MGWVPLCRACRFVQVKSYSRKVKHLKKKNKDLLGHDLLTNGNVWAPHWPSSLNGWILCPFFISSWSSKSKESISIIQMWKTSSSRLSMRWRLQWTHRQRCLLARPYSEYMFCTGHMNARLTAPHLDGGIEDPLGETEKCVHRMDLKQALHVQFAGTMII